MTLTRWSHLLAIAVVAGLLGFLLGPLAYRHLPALPTYAPVTAVLIGLFELGLARVVSQKVRGRSAGRPLHPLQVARAVVLAKASSVAGAILLGLYGGYFWWTFQARSRLAAAEHDAQVSALSSGAALLLVVAALLLERACRTPKSTRLGGTPDADARRD